MRIIKEVLCSDNTLGGYAILRNAALLNGGAVDTDVDLIVAKGYLQAYENRICRAAKICGGEVIGVARSVAFLKVCTLGREDPDEGWWGLRFDLMEEMTFEGYILLDSEFLIGLSIERNGLSEIRHPFDDLIGAFKDLLFQGARNERYSQGASEAFMNYREDVERLFRPLGPEALAIFRDSCLAWPGSTSDMRVAASRLRGAIRRFGVRSGVRSYLFRWAEFYFLRIRRFLSPPGLFVAILGTDGAGKSTVIDAIRPVLEAATHAKISKRHLRPMFLPALGKLIHSRDNNRPDIDVEPHGSPPAGRLGSLARLIWLWADYVLGYWLIVRPSIARAPTVFLFDRYADDLALDPRRFRLGHWRDIASLVPRFVPRPDLLIALHADPEIIHARKPELPIDEVVRQVGALRDWAANRPEAVLIDTGSATVSETRDEVLEALMVCLRRRKRKRDYDCGTD